MLKEQIQRFKDNGIAPAYIAKRAGISKTTLSLWLNGCRDNISDETKGKIEDAMRDIVASLNDTLYANSNPTGVEYDDDF